MRLIRERPGVAYGVAGALALVALLFWARNRGEAPVEADAEMADVAALADQRDAEGLVKIARSADRRPAVSARALEALATVDRRAAMQPAMSFLSDARPELRTTAAAVLATVPEPAPAIPVLRTTLQKDREPRVRRASANALGQLRAWEGLDALAAALDDKDALVREAAHTAVYRIMGIKFAFDPYGPRDQRLRAMADVRRLIPGGKQLFDDYNQRRAAGR
ncbi:MAG TPA: HEAT repeat domain-containing protein [Tepidisphaeraceae bacterium]|nr:HEAT repeat domain-containing protein [Tepidisphaeraceae bacterium]